MVERLIMKFYYFLILLIVMSCKQQTMESFDIQGHRGCRGLYPENSIPGFLHAIDLGVTTLEFDAVISKDHQVVISHEPFMSHYICTDSNGRDINEENELSHNMYELTYEQIKMYDCGSTADSRYPDRKNLSVHKPSLADVVGAVKNHLKQIDRESILYNIEIKRKEEWDNSYHPDYKSFADLVINEILRLEIQEYTTVQCFNVPTLQYVKEAYPDIKLVYLIQNTNSIETNIETLGFIPEIYSPYFKLINEDVVSYCNTNNVRLIPWTANELQDMIDLIDIGVHGIITDYPDILINYLNEKDQ